jgi:hypothetical protein
MEKVVAFFLSRRFELRYTLRVRAPKSTLVCGSIAFCHSLEITHLDGCNAYTMPFDGYQTLIMANGFCAKSKNEHLSYDLTVVSRKKFIVRRGVQCGSDSAKLQSIAVREIYCLGLWSIA